MANPECPACGGTDVEPHDGDCFYCRKCSGVFDANSDEGGDYSDHAPSYRLLREERRAEQRRTRCQRGARQRRRGTGL